MVDLLDGLVTESKIFKGAGRVVYAGSVQGFPTQLSDVIDTGTFVLASGWSDFGATTTDGITVTRAFDKDEGVEVDQLASRVLKGGVKNWRGTVGMTLLHSSLEMMKIAMEGGDIETGSGERTLLVGSPSSVTERKIAVLQKHSKTSKLRMIVFRKATLAAEELSMAIKSGDAVGIPVKFDLEADSEIADPTENMFAVIEQT